MPKQKVVIIGAGIGGLATSNLLAKAGFDVHVYEKDATPGGRAGTVTVDGFTFDTGPSWYLMPDVFEHFFSLLDEPIDTWLELLRLQPAYKVYFEKHEPVTITGSLGTDANTFEVIESGSGKKLEEYVKRADVIYQLAMKRFLYSNFTSLRDFLKKDVLMRGLGILPMLLQPIDSYVGKFVKDTRLKQILEYPMVFLGTSPFSAPSMYSLMSALDFKEGVFYPKGGMYTIIESIVSIGTKLGVSYHYNEKVSTIDTKESTIIGITTNDTFIPADIVISNADLHHTETSLLEKADQSYPESYWNSKEAGPSALLMYLGIKGSLPELEHHNLLFVDDWKTNFDAIYTTKSLPKDASIYISKTSQTDPGVAPKGYETIFILVPLPSGVSVAPKQVKKLASQYLQQIKDMAGIDLASRIVSQTFFGPNDFQTKFYSWQSSMLGQSHLLRQSAFFRTPNVSKKVKNLYYVGGNTTPGIGLPMCLIGAELIYKRLAGDKYGGRVDAIRPIAKDIY